MKRDTPQRRARLWLHDQVCQSGCADIQRDDHAARTQGARGSALARAVATGWTIPVVEALHPSWCLAAARGQCTTPKAHHEALVSKGIAASAITAVKGE